MLYFVSYLLEVYRKAIKYLLVSNLFTIFAVSSHWMLGNELLAIIRGLALFYEKDVYAFFSG